MVGSESIFSSHLMTIDVGIEEQDSEKGQRPGEICVLMNTVESTNDFSHPSLFVRA